MSKIRHQPVAPTQAENRAPGDAIDRHRHDGHQLIYVSSGVLAITTERGSWVVPPDRALWIPAGIWHEHRFHGHSAFHTLGFTMSDTPLPVDGPTVVAVNDLIRGLIMASTEPDLPVPEAQRLRAVLGDRLKRAQVQPLSLPTATDRRLADACTVVLKDLAQPRSIRSLAHSVGTSERTLARLFRSEFGSTYPQWRTQARVFQAMIELADGASVTQAGLKCGWSTPSAFIETFGRTAGETPGSYRAAALSEPAL
ncbi:AraC family transcriptional regulator [Rhodococcus koreensis]